MFINEAGTEMSFSELCEYLAELAHDYKIAASDPELREDAENAVDIRQQILRVCVEIQARGEFGR